MIGNFITKSGLKRHRVTAKPCVLANKCTLHSFNTSNPNKYHWNIMYNSSQKGHLQLNKRSLIKGSEHTTRSKHFLPLRHYFGINFFKKLSTSSEENVFEESSRAVNIAIAANSLCSIMKFGAFLYTGSGSLMSEALHSFADLVNQIFLYIGIQRSKREPTEDHPLGFGGERFIWALISAVGLFTFGSAGSIVHGIHSFFDPTELTHLSVAFWVLGASFALESISIVAAVRAIYVGAKDNGMSFLQYVRHGPDPMGVAVLLEDGSAIVGIVIAGAFTWLTYATGLAVYDAFGSIMIGGLLGVTAVFLIKKNVSSLVGKSMPKVKRDVIKHILESRPDIDNVHTVKAVMIGADVATVSAEVVFKGSHFVEEYLKDNSILELAEKTRSEEGLKEVLDDYSEYIVSHIGKQVDSMEESIRKQVPETKFVDIESHYQKM